MESIFTPDMFNLNHKPDPFDARDYLFKVAAPLVLAPDYKMDLKADGPPIRNQLKYGSCVGHGVVYSRDLLQMRELRKKGKQSHEYNSTKFMSSSPMFTYYFGRAAIKQELVDSGCYIRDAVKAGATVGFCTEDKWKYVDKNLFKKPTKGPMTEAGKNKIGQYVRLTTLDQIKSCLIEGFPVVFGASLYENFFSAAASKTGRIPYPAGKYVGGHCMVLVGIDEAAQEFDLANSWGLSWGNKGYGRIGYNYIGSKLVSDLWTIRA